MTRPLRSHGASGYAAGCRCGTCTAAMTRRSERTQRRRQQRVASGELQVPHGTNNGYVNYRCRCDSCKAAASEYQREYRLSWRPDR